MFSSIYTVFYCKNVYPICTKGQNYAASAAAERGGGPWLPNKCLHMFVHQKAMKMMGFGPKPHTKHPVVHTHLLSSFCVPNTLKVHLRPGGHAPELFLATPLTCVELWAKHYLPAVAPFCPLNTRKFSAARRSYWHTYIFLPSYRCKRM